jgi:hypothetical protein
MATFKDPAQMETYSSPDDIAAIVYDAATDGKDLLRYVADLHMAQVKADAPIGGGELIAKPSVPRQNAFWMANVEARIGQRRRLAVIVAGIGKHGHVVEPNSPAIQGIESDLGIRRCGFLQEQLSQQSEV